MTQDAQLPTQLKASATSSTNSDPVNAVSSRAPPLPPRRPTASEPNLRSPPDRDRDRERRRTPRSSASSDFLSDKATSLLIRRVLCPQQAAGDRGRVTPVPIDELLPPLTSRNDVDLQLYAIIAIILRDFVQAWYSKITTDETFVEEIVKIIAHCTRALEQRLRKADLESILFDELPDLLDSHVQAYRASRKPISRPPIDVDSREIYHSLCPLPYLSPIPRLEEPDSIAEQAENELAYRQLLVQGVLAILLPTEDLENECLTSLVGQILSELVIGGVVAKKISEPWMIWAGLSILTDVIRRRRTNAVDPGPSRDGPLRQGSRGFSVQWLFWSFLQWVFLLTTFVRVLVTTLAMSRTLPPRARHVAPRKEKLTRHKDGEPSVHTLFSVEAPSEPVKVPIMAFGIWTAMSNLIETSRRMPWLCGSLSMLQWLAMTGPGRIAGVDGGVDRLLSDSIHRYILDPTNLPAALRNLRGVLFPNNAMGTQTMFPPSSEQELLALRRKCASAIWTLVPKSAGRLYFGGSTWQRLWPHASDSRTRISGGSSVGTSPRTGPTNTDGGGGGLAHVFVHHNETPPTDQQKPEKRRQYYLDENKAAVGSSNVSTEQQKQKVVDDDDEHIISEIETEILDVFSDAYCNKHLMYSALELILVRLMPELATTGVVELWEERLS